jgi:hypothetical protein
MGHTESLEHLTPEEQDFQFQLGRGEDFVKIEVFRHALSHYYKALEMGMDNEKVNERIVYCRKMIKKESRILITLACIAVVIVGISLLFHYT